MTALEKKTSIVGCPLVTGCPQPAHCSGASRSAAKRKRNRAHAELRVHKHIERVGANARRELRRAPPLTVPEMVGTRGEPLRKRIDTGQQVIHKHFEIGAGKIGNPVLEIAAGGAVPKERREEPDLDPRPGANTRAIAGAATPAPALSRARARGSHTALAAACRRRPDTREESCSSAARRAVRSAARPAARGGASRSTVARPSENASRARATAVASADTIGSVRQRPNNARSMRASVASACAYAARAPARSSRSASVPANSNAALASRRSSSQARAKSSAAAGRSLRSRRSPASVTIAPRWFGSRVSARRNAISAPHVIARIALQRTQVRPGQRVAGIGGDRPFDRRRTASAPRPATRSALPRLFHARAYRDRISSHARTPSTARSFIPASAHRMPELVPYARLRRVDGERAVEIDDRIGQVA